MMRALHVYKTMLPESVGGVETFIDALCRAMQPAGVESTVFALSSRPDSLPTEAAGYKLVWAKQDFYLASTGFSLQAFSMFRRLVAGADIIHYHHPNPFADLLHFTAGVKKPTVLTYHSDIIKQKNLLRLYKPMMRRFLTRAGAIVATSPDYAASSETLSYFREKTRVIPPGVDRAGYPTPSRARLERWRAALPRKFFLFLGAIRYYKGLHILLEAVKDTALEVVIAGSGKPETKLKKQASGSGMQNVRFLGRVSEEDKMALLQLCYAFVLPSHLRSEAFGISLLEAAMCGKAMINADIGTGSGFINLDGKTGLAVKPADPQALQKAMRYLAENPKKTADFGKNALKRQRNKFTVAAMGESYLALYKELSGRESPNKRRREGDSNPRYG